MKKRICTIIINYKTALITRNCVESLVPQLNSDADHIIIVDNNSGDAEIELLKSGLMDFTSAGIVTILPLNANNGFSSGNNAGITACPAEFYLLANSDTLFLPGAITGLLEGASKHPDAGLLSPRLEWPDEIPQVSCFRFPSPLTEIIRSANTGPITSLFRRYDVPLAPEKHVTHPEWTSFACVLIRDKVIKKIGLLDDGFFMYHEDIDYCRRLRQAGFNIVNWPEARVIHLQGKSSEVDNNKREKKSLPDYFYHSRARYYRKYYGNIGFLTANILWIIGRGISMFRQVFMGNERPVPQREFFNIWKSKSLRKGM
ncbi:glycosyltransferase family 2 protein [Spirochaeta isovalerica]|uniref:Glycosyltransferase 2-like domain-containing protein n=1 Tax=Spirochaeta isovalerica TaxID=150 RepID=A0A841R954_9SPIO|nr:glycosyltransferase family 2 protein [Spirochaeta isovalerica]MBB6479248.1 hypothetical protein [Spirochaeta isovalerica]